LAASGDAIDTDVDDDGSGLHHVGGDKFGPADGGDEHVGLAGERSEIGGAGVADGDGAVGTRALLQGEQCDGFTDDQRAAEDDDVFAFEVGPAAREEFHDAGGRAGDETGIVLLRDFAEVEGVEAVDVLVGRDAAEDRDLIDVFRQGRLDENAVDRGVSALSSSIREKSSA
jgi:hypothetical protein